MHKYFTNSAFILIVLQLIFNIVFDIKTAFTATTNIVGNNIISCGIIRVKINAIPCFIPKLDNIDVTVNPIE